MIRAGIGRTVSSQGHGYWPTALPNRQDLFMPFRRSHVTFSGHFLSGLRVKQIIELVYRIRSLFIALRAEKPPGLVLLWSQVGEVIWEFSIKERIPFRRPTQG